MAGTYQTYGRPGVQTYSHGLDVAVSAVTVNGATATFTDSGTAITISSPAIHGGETIVLTEAANETTGPDIMKVQVTNFPASSGGSGAGSANQYPGADYAKDGTDATGVAAPTGGVGIRGWLSGIYAKLSGSIAVTGTFWQATQPVSGTFWQATQPVSGTFWQTTQPVSAAAGTLVDGADATQGTKADTAATSGTAAWSVVALLKGIYNALVAATPAGSAIIGKVGIDQTTAGTTNGVVVNSSALPAGAATAANQQGIVAYADTYNSSLTANQQFAVPHTVPAPNIYSKFYAYIMSPQAASYNVQGSNDGFATTAPNMLVGTVAANTPVIVSVPALFAAHRVVFTNGATAAVGAFVLSGYSVT